MSYSLYISCLKWGKLKQFYLLTNAVSPIYPLYNFCLSWVNLVKCDLLSETLSPSYFIISLMIKLRKSSSVLSPCWDSISNLYNNSFIKTVLSLKSESISELSFISFLSKLKKTSLVLFPSRLSISKLSFIYLWRFHWGNLVSSFSEPKHYLSAILYILHVYNEEENWLCPASKLRIYL